MMRILITLLAVLALLGGASGQISYAGDVAFLGSTETESTIVLSGAIAESAPTSAVTATYTAELAENANIVFTAVEGTTWGGALGNSLSIIVSDPGEERATTNVTDITDGAVTVTVSSTAVPAINATGQDIIDAIAANATAAAMMVATNDTGSDGSGTATALGEQSLAGGVNGTAGSTGEVQVYGGDVFVLVSGTTFYNSRWVQLDGGYTDGSVASTRGFSTTGTVSAEQLTSTDDATVAGAMSVGEGLTVTGTITNAGLQALQALPYWHIQTIEIPALGAADCIDSTVTIDATGFELAAGDLDAQPDVPRTIVVTPSGALTGWILIEGTNIDSDNISEYVNFSASSDAAATDAAFASITGISGKKTDGDDRTINVGTTDELGLDIVGRVVDADLAGVPESTEPTLTVGTTIEKYTADLSGTLDGTKDVTLYIVAEAS